MNNKKLTAYLVGGIFSLITWMGIVTMIIGLGELASMQTTHRVSGGNIDFPFVLILGYIILYPAAIGSFVCGIVGLVGTCKRFQNHGSYGLMLAAGIVGIIGIPIANSILFFMAYSASKKNNNGNNHNNQNNNGNNHNNQNNNGNNHNNQNNNGNNYNDQNNNNQNMVDNGQYKKYKD